MKGAEGGRRTCMFNLRPTRPARQPRQAATDAPTVSGTRPPRLPVWDGGAAISAFSKRPRWAMHHTDLQRAVELLVWHLARRTTHLNLSIYHIDLQSVIVARRLWLWRCDHGVRTTRAEPRQQKISLVW